MAVSLVVASFSAVTMAAEHASDIGAAGAAQPTRLPRIIRHPAVSVSGLPIFGHATCFRIFGRGISPTCARRDHGHSASVNRILFDRRLVSFELQLGHFHCW